MGKKALKVVDVNATYTDALEAVEEAEVENQTVESSEN